jgi:peptidylprolyl isomerase domain and WD repeat-containing protein 1
MDSAMETKRAGLLRNGREIQRKRRYRTDKLMLMVKRPWPWLTTDDDDDVGPMPVDDAPKKKRRGMSIDCDLTNKVLPHEKTYLDQLPSSSRYMKSFMHRDPLAYVTVTPSTDFVITTSVDGVVKFWKKQAVGIEFVKQYRGHLGPVTTVSVSADGTMFASASSDKTVKIFDVPNFGISLQYIIHCRFV